MESVIKVGDIMTRNFISTFPDTNLRECAKIMVKKRVGSLVILEDGKLLGILTEKDIIYALVKTSKKELKKILARDLMKRKVVTIKPTADITEAMDRFRKKKIRRLPVVENGKVIGFLTTKDALKIDPGLYELIHENVKIKEETRKLRTGKIKDSEKAGMCEECGEVGPLFKQDSQWLCEGCYEKI